ncbi:sec-independent translocase [Streptomyces sp. MST-110588]|uniref:sec-independent translocase n=1 Tax=Streptomyces sp. MST-110588 TaxID=2833628 RepID=UPI001F5C6F9E|nr:sec-independent translocase [Streptomyces sp. MST-110588]UNO40068.1 Sec-independent protein translocase subunit TatB [Streptomyces sp. MST-110588]
MFFDIGPLELVALVILAVLIFGPDKLPKVIQDVTGFIRKVRQFSDNAKEDIRSELGPEFKDFEFEDLKPRNFVRKHVLEKDEFGLQEIRNGFDLRQEMAEVTEAVNGTGPSSAPSPSSAAGSRLNLSKEPPAAGPGGGSPDLLKKPGRPARTEHPPFDSDAT